MTRWAKIDHRYLLNPKVRAASAAHPLAPLVHLAAILQAADHLTDGTVDTLMVLAAARAPEEALAACVDAGLLEPVDDSTVRVHDYTAWQTPAEKVRDVSQKRSAAGAKGAARRWREEGSAKWQNGKTDGKTDGKTMANEMANEPAKPAAETTHPEPGDNSTELAEGGEHAKWQNGKTMANTMANPWLEHRTKNIEQERENEGDQTAPAPATLSPSRFTIQLSEALRARSIRHRITPSWETTWQRLTAAEGEAELDRLLTWALTEPSDFWATTCTTPARFEKHLDTIRAQAARQPRTTTPPTGSSPSGAPDRTPDPPPEMETEADRQAWRMTWIAHSRRGIPDDLATDYTNADLGITPTPGAEIISLRNYA